MADNMTNINGDYIPRVAVVDPTTGLPVNPAGGGGGGASAVYTLGAPIAVAVTTAAGQLLASRAARKKLIIQVVGATDVALSFDDTDPSFTAGLVLAANDNGAGYPGGSVTIEHIGKVRGIARGSASSVIIFEGT